MPEHPKKKHNTKNQHTACEIHKVTSWRRRLARYMEEKSHILYTTRALECFLCSCITTIQDGASNSRVRIQNSDENKNFNIVINNFSTPFCLIIWLIIGRGFFCSLAQVRVLHWCSWIEDSNNRHDGDHHYCKITTIFQSQKHTNWSYTQPKWNI